MFNVSDENFKKIYKCNVYTHLIEIELLKNNKNDFVRLWYNYNNNYNCIPLYYNASKNILYGAKITDKQKEIIIKKIKNALKIHNKQAKKNEELKKLDFVEV